MPIRRLMIDTARAAFRKAGVDFRRWTPRCDASLRAATLLKRLDASVLLDVGANTGQFVRSMRAHGWRGRAISIEPGAAAHRSLCRMAAADSAWEVADRVAIGLRAGRASLNVSANSVSSSIHPMLEVHTAAAPESRVVRTEEVPVMSLDELAARHRVEGRVFLKIDTQGSEMLVLRGGEATLMKCVAVLCEVSIVPMYQSGTDWEVVLGTLRERGFEVWAIESGFSHPTTGQMYQCDLLMVRTEALERLSS